MARAAITRAFQSWGSARRSNPNLAEQASQTHRSATTWPSRSKADSQATLSLWPQTGQAGMLITSFDMSRQISKIQTRNPSPARPRIFSLDVWEFLPSHSSIGRATGSRWGAASSPQSTAPRTSGPVVRALQLASVRATRFTRRSPRGSRRARQRRRGIRGLDRRSRPIHWQRRSRGFVQVAGNPVFLRSTPIMKCHYR
jgi:hypothetical protein